MNILRIVEGIDPVSISDITDPAKVSLSWVGDLSEDMKILCRRFRKERPEFKK
jgi:hypothetical protein